MFYLDITDRLILIIIYYEKKEIGRSDTPQTFLSVRRRIFISKYKIFFYYESYANITYKYHVREEIGMADIARKVAYFALDVPNKSGEGARILGALAEAGVNLLAFSGFPNGRKSQLDIIPEDVNVLKKAVRTTKIKTRAQKFGFLIQGNDRKGAVANILQKLADKEINVTAIDAVSAGAGRYAAILWVNPKDVNKTAKTLGAK
jgi:hypothetical protein